MSSHISILSSALTDADRAFLADPPPWLDFDAGTSTERQPALLSTVRNASVLIYLSTLQRIRLDTLSLPPAPNSLSLLRKVHLLSNLQSRADNIARFIFACFSRQQRYSFPLVEVSFDFEAYQPCHNSPPTGTNPLPPTTYPISPVSNGAYHRAPGATYRSLDNRGGSQPPPVSIAGAPRAITLPSGPNTQNMRTTRNDDIAAIPTHENPRTRTNAQSIPAAENPSGISASPSSVPSQAPATTQYFVDRITSAVLQHLDQFGKFEYSTEGELFLPHNALYPSFYRCKLRELIESFYHFSVADLMSIARAHRIIPPESEQRHTRKHWLAKLLAHPCSESCDRVIYCFSRRTRKWSQKQMNDHRQKYSAELEAAAITEEDNPEPALRGTSAYTPVSDELRDEIIAEWQDEMSTAKQKNAVCACCSRGMKPSLIENIDVERVPFHLLRNDELPAHILPSDDEYAFNEYGRALLNPKGLSNKFEKAGKISLCFECRTPLLRRTNPQMPKYSLANWLYYGHNRLPSDIKEAFANASLFEKSLICRARAHRINYRYCHKTGSPEYGKSPSTSQGYSKGNAIVFPQESITLNDALPPTVDSVRDTLCVLFLASSDEAVKENIQKLNPCLVRKSRVRTMIEFLVSHNQHYARSDNFVGFSPENLEALIDQEYAVYEGDDVTFKPAGVEIAFLDSNSLQGEVEVTADYTNRNDVDASDGQTMDDYSDLLMENVGYTDGDTSPKRWDEMKLKALEHCLAGNRFIQSRTSSTPMNDFENPKLLSMLFPHLDPWGIGGFHHEKRTRKYKLTLENQLRYLVSLDESPFALDPTFAFVYHSISRKKKLTNDCLFRIKRHQYSSLVESLLAQDPELVTQLQAKFEVNPKYQPSDPSEKRLLQTLNDLHCLQKSVPGSNGHKKELRNEIRALINRLGAPALFITINPNDVNNPLVRLLAGDQIDLEASDRGEDLSKYLRQVLAAKNPKATATYFHRVINSFINTVLRYGKRKPGLFGKCTAYYGMVEAQGKGTLHCHFLIWLDGHLSPQELRDKISESDEFKKRVFTYLESIIKCELPSDTSVVEVEGQMLAPPTRARDEPNPAVIALPRVSEMAKDEFDAAFHSMVEKLVIENHWHRHNQTCWKYLKRGEPKDDAHCRMRIDGSTRPTTTLDEETKSILLRRLHPRINSYNDVLSFLTQSNNDIQFIGSGEAAKALIFYVTDYITKASLPTHVGLSALRVAIEKNRKKFEGDPTADFDTVGKSLFVKTANAILGRTELSHPQVMSYILGHDDHYSSHQFQKLLFGAFIRHVERWFEDDNADMVTGGEESDLGIAEREIGQGDRNDSMADEVHPPEEPEEPEEEERDEEEVVTVQLHRNKSITMARSLDDYIYRSEQAPFDAVSLYHFAARFKKSATRKKKTASTSVTRDVDGPSEDGDVEEYIEVPTARRQQQSNPSSKFLQQHPQFQTHHLSQMAVEHVPVILGPTIPHPSKGPEARELWSRAMLTLFKSWRLPSDLKQPDESWAAAFEREDFDPSDRKIMGNMVVLNECREARNVDASKRRDRGTRGGWMRTGSTGEDEIEEIEAVMLMEEAEALVAGSVERQVKRLDEQTRRASRKTVADMLNIDLESLDGPSGAIDQNMQLRTQEWDEEHLDSIVAFVNGLKTKRPRVDDNDGEIGDGSVVHSRKRRRTTRHEELNVATVDENQRTHDTRHQWNAQSHIVHAPSDEEISKQVIVDFHLDSNPEQLRAFKIIADRAIRRGPQLLMYIGGIGGTGKSHIISAVVELFLRLGRRKELELSAPTGAAGVLIKGSTIHSLTGLPNKKNVNIQALAQIWRNIHWLIIDEVSMIGAGLLHDIAERIKLAKRHDEGGEDLPMGGVNVIFTGDFGQLKPVNDRTVFSNQLVHHVDTATASSKRSQEQLFGAMVWRQVTDVVLLRKNQRQANDPVYAGLISRIRTGSCIFKPSPQHPISDFSLLNSRILATLAKADPSVYATFEDAPVIVGRKVLRDEINYLRLHQAAQRLGQRVLYFHSRDTLSECPLPSVVQEAAWKADSTTTKDSLGILPLFPGMRVMITENVALEYRLVNGAEGIVRAVDYAIDENGINYAKICYVYVEGSGVKMPNLDQDVVPLLPVPASFSCVLAGKQRRISRRQLPLLPGYAYTDYKSQGRTLRRAIVDLHSAASLAGAYVMLSRVKSLDGIAIYDYFDKKRIDQRLSEELRAEYARLDDLDQQTKEGYAELLSDDQQDVSMMDC